MCRHVEDSHHLLIRRHHVAVFVDGDAIGDKRKLMQPLGEHAEVYVMQALSGG